MVMDYLRSAYVSLMQFDEAGSIVVPVVWYRCAPGAKVFPVPHLFSSSNWDTLNRQGIGIGEQWNSTFAWYNGAAPFPATGSGSFCGKLDWYQNGCPSDAPPIVYDPFGNPGCCLIPFVYDTTLSVSFTGTQPGCQMWNPSASTSGRSCVNLTLGQTGVVTTNTSTQFIGHFTTSPTITFNAIDSGSCFGQSGTLFSLKQGSTINTCQLVGYNPLTGVGLWKNPFTTGLFPQDYFRLTLPH